MSSLFGSQLITKQGTKSTDEVLKGKKLVAIYFSAHWCPPCRGFTPVLSEFYNKVVKQDEDALEVIFASSDNDDEAFEEYYGEQPWVALPYGSSYINTLAQKYAVRGIPTLVVLNASDLSTVDPNARATVTGAISDIGKALTKWGI